MLKKTTEENLVRSGILLYYFLLLVMAFALDGTGDEGDSELHFAHLSHVFNHPEIFFHHWSKPIFVLLASPFAQFGFVGVKVFNSTIYAATIYLSYRLAKQFAMPNAWLVPVVLAFARLGLVMALSSFTEPLFAFWLVVGIWLHTRSRQNVEGFATGQNTATIWKAVIWFSFLPFVRSEGLVVFCVYMVYLLLRGLWRYLPLLAVGHLVYSVAGYPVHKNIFWAFKPTPYMNAGSIYGSGKLDHFIWNLPEVVGTVIPFMLLLGLTEGGIRLVSTLSNRRHSPFLSDSAAKESPFTKEELWLVYGIFVGYFSAHSLFWYWGMFNSCGLLRVLVGVLPLIALISVRGLNGVYRFFEFSKNRMTPLFLKITSIGLLVLGLFDSLKLYHLQVLGIQKSMQYAADYVRAHYPDWRSYTTYLESPHYAIYQGLDYLSPKDRRSTGQMLSGEPIPKKSFVIWEDFFMPFNGQLSLEKMKADKRFRFIETFQERDKRFGNLRTTCLFEYDTTSVAYWEANTLFKTDFETDTTAAIDSSQAFSGRKSFRLAVPHEYSPGFNGVLSSFPMAEKQAILNLTCQIKAIDTTALGLTSVIYSFEHENAEVFEWRAVPLRKVLKTTQDWQNVHLTESLRPPQYPTDRLKVYLWNPSAKLILVDDLRIVLQ